MNTAAELNTWVRHSHPTTTDRDWWTMNVEHARRRICECRCGKVYRVDTVVSYRATRYENDYYHKVHRTGEVETHLDGRRVVWPDSYKCPDCQREPKKINVVKGVKTEHKCGAKCRSSKSGKCECSCGGVNHGANH